MSQSQSSSRRPQQQSRQSSSQSSPRRPATPAAPALPPGRIARRGTAPASATPAAHVQQGSTEDLDTQEFRRLYSRLQEAEAQGETPPVMGYDALRPPAGMEMVPAESIDSGDDDMEDSDDDEGARFADEEEDAEPVEDGETDEYVEDDMAGYRRATQEGMDDFGYTVPESRDDELPASVRGAIGPLPPLPPRRQLTAREQNERYSRWVDLGDFRDLQGHRPYYPQYDGWKMKVRRVRSVAFLEAAERFNDAQRAAQLASQRQGKKVTPTIRSSDIIAVLQDLVVAWNFVHVETWTPLPQPPVGLRFLDDKQMAAVLNVAMAEVMPSKNSSRGSTRR